MSGRIRTSVSPNHGSDRLAGARGPATRPRAGLVVVLALTLMAWPTAADAQSLAGDWLGSVRERGFDIRVVVHFTVGADGALTGTLDSPDQGTQGLRLSSLTVTGPSITFTVDAIKAVYAGTFNASTSTIEGSWSQPGQGSPLTFARVTDKAAIELRRPQTPMPPFPYRAEPVRYRNAVAGIFLAGTLTIPEGRGPFPTVLLITGSGPQDRDETIVGHKPFLVLADYLTRHGIAVLRSDDRGVGQSEGTFGSATTENFATDAEAGLAYLRKRTEVDHGKVGLVGHSEGALIAAMVAARSPDVAFIVMMAGPGEPGADILPAQAALIERANGAPDSERVDTLRDLLKMAAKEPDDEVLAAKARKRLAGTMPPAQIEAQIQTLTSPWYRFVIAYDPAVALRRVRCPVLAIAGDKDVQVPPRQNLKAIRDALQEGGNRNVEVRELPGLNHLFQTAATGSPAEYSRIAETMSPVVLDLVTSWILKR